MISFHSLFPISFHSLFPISFHSLFPISFHFFHSLSIESNPTLSSHHSIRCSDGWQTLFLHSDMESKGTPSQFWQQDEYIKNIFHRGKFSLQSISMALAVSFFSLFLSSSSFLSFFDNFSPTHFSPSRTFLPVLWMTL